MDKHCANCIYRCYITAGLYCCDYIGCTGHARSLICPPGARCTEKKTVQRTPPNPNGRPKAVFDEATCMQLYQRYQDWEALWLIKKSNRRMEGSE